MKPVKELIISLLFFAIYAPLSIAMWYTTDGKLSRLVVIMGIGVVIIIGYLSFELIRHRFQRIRLRKIRRTIFGTRTKLRLELEPEEEIFPEVMDEPEEEPDNMVGFRNLFSQNKPGGEAL